MPEATTSRQVKSIERKLDLWLKIKITKDNVYKATNQILDAVHCDSKKTWEDGHMESGGWRYKDRTAAISAQIVSIEDEKVKNRLWKKLLRVVTKIYRTTKDDFVLSHCGHLELYLQEAERKIRKFKPGEETYVYLWDLGRVIHAYSCHRDKINLFANPSKTQMLVEELIGIVLDFIKDKKDLHEYYWSELDRYVEVFLFHEKPIPATLHLVAEYMIKRDKNELRNLTEKLKKESQELRAHIQKIKDASSAK